MQKYLMEVLGTYLLVLAYGVSGEPLALGLALIALTYMGFKISGAHYNPAVSTAFFVKGKLSGALFVTYLSLQLLGALLAALTIGLLSGSAYYIVPPYDSGIIQQTFGELIFSFLFIYIFLECSLNSKFYKGTTYGLIIGLTFAAMLYLSQDLSGGVINPATALGYAIYDLMEGGDSYKHLLMYGVSPLAGGTIAAALHTYFNR